MGTSHAPGWDPGHMNARTGSVNDLIRLPGRANTKPRYSLAEGVPRGKSRASGEA